MAGDAQDGAGADGGAPEGDGQAADDAVADVTGRLGPVFDHTHDRVTTAIVVGFAAAVGLLAGWIVADFGVRSLGFIVGAVGSAYLLYRQPTRRAVLAAGFYSLAALVAVVPFVYELGLAANVDDPLRHLLSVTDLLLFLAFWLLAAVPALVGYRVATGPFLRRLRG